MVLLDFLTARGACFAAYSVRTLSASGTGGPVFRLRRSSDNAEDDFWEVNNKYFNGSKQYLEKWLGGATAFVKTWYDQSGRNNHATNATTTQQPTLVYGGTDWTKRPTVRFDGTASNLPFDGTGMTSGGVNGYAVFATVARNSSKSANYFLGGSSTSSQNLYLGFSTDTSYIHSLLTGATYTITVPGFSARAGLVLAVRSYPLANTKNTTLDGGAFNGNIPTASIGNSTSLTAYAGAALGLFQSTNYYAGDITEMIMMSENVSDIVRSLVETQMGAYHKSQDALPLAGTTPRFVFSTRNLMGSTGAILKLRRSSDNAEMDFYGYGVYGGVLLSLARQTPEQWLAGATGYVVTWYDQSANKQHATGYVAGTGTLPILTAVNGEYVVQFNGSSSANGGYFDAGAVTLNSVAGGHTAVARVNLKTPTSGERVYDCMRSASESGWFLGRNGPVTRFRYGPTSAQYLEVSDGSLKEQKQVLGYRAVMNSATSLSSLVLVDLDSTRKQGGASFTVAAFSDVYGSFYIGKSSVSSDSYSNMDMYDLVIHDVNLSDYVFIKINAQLDSRPRTCTAGKVQSG